MAVLSTKFNIGDEVWFAHIETEVRCHPCPDCNGARLWKATSPAGAEYTFDCPRCNAGYLGNRELSLNYTVFAAHAVRRTIGSIEARTSALPDEDDRVRYMCRETGVGSGNVYSEADLFASKDEAMEAAEHKAAEANKKTDWVATQYNRSLEIKDYQLSDATKTAAENLDRRRRYAVDDLISDLRECATMEEVRERIERGLSQAAE